MFVMIVRMNGLYLMVLVGQMHVLSVRAQIFIERPRIEDGRGQIGVLVVVEADAGGQFNENMHTNRN